MWIPLMRHTHWYLLYTVLTFQMLPPYILTKHNIIYQDLRLLLGHPHAFMLPIVGFSFLLFVVDMNALSWSAAISFACGWYICRYPTQGECGGGRQGEISGGDALWDFLMRRGRKGFSAGNEKQLTVKAVRLFLKTVCRKFWATGSSAGPAETGKVPWL